MISPKTKIGLFLLSILVLGWLLYPRTLFLGYIFEGQSRLGDAETYYQNYLRDYPHSKFATLRLVDLYERMGTPEKAMPYMKTLFDYRRKDWELAQRYLNYLEQLHDDKRLFDLKLEIVDRFKSDPVFPKGRLEEILYQSLQYARWQQDADKTESLLKELISLGRDDISYQEQLDALYQSQKKSDHVVKQVEAKLRQNPEDRNLREELVAIYQIVGRWKDAITLVTEALSLLPDDPQWLFLRSELFQHEKNWLEAEGDLRVLINQNPESRSPTVLEKRAQYKVRLAFVLQKQKKSEEAIVIFEDLLASDPEKRDHWLNLIYALSDSHQNEKLMAVLKRYVEKYPGDTVQQQNYDSLLLSKRLFDDYLSRNPHDPEKLLIVGKEYYFATRYREAAPYLQESVNRRARAESWYWFAENEWALEHYAQSKRGFKNVLAQLPESQASRGEKRRMWLKASGRERFDRDLDQRYQKAIKEEPRLEALQSDYVGLLLENQKYEQALPYLAIVSAREPHNRYLQRDLAEAHRRTGAWKRSMQELESLHRQTGDRYQVEQPLKEMHRVYDDRITGTFDISDLGSDEWQSFTTHYQTYLSESLKLTSNVSVGHFNFSGAHHVATYGELGLGYRLAHDWNIGGGLGFGVSSQRQTPSPFFSLQYGRRERLLLRLESQYRQLRTDLSQIVDQGGLVDHSQIYWESLLWERVILAGHYRFDRNYLPAGEKAFEHHFEPAISFILFRKPYVTLGYQFSLSQVVDRGYLSVISLIPKSRTHYLTGLVNMPFGKNFSLEGGFYLGEDTTRDLHLFKGDLFGLRGRLEWAIFPWLDLEGEYQFGRQTLTSITGQSHRGTVGLSVHW